MKRYADYTKDDLMRLLESLTPGGSEFYESPENCARFIRERKGKPPAAPDLLAALTEVLARLERVDPLPDGGTSSLRDNARAAIAAAKGEK